MGLDDLPTLKHQKRQLRDLRALVRINGWLRHLGIGIKALERIAPQLDEIEKQMDYLTECPREYNRRFAEHGWVFHDSMDMRVAQHAIDEYDANGIASATAVLIDYYGSNRVAERLSLFNHADALRVRRRMIDLALAEHSQGRLYAAVPLLLMVIDGAMNDVAGRGLHAKDLDVDVWDSVVVADGAIYKVREVFQKGRRKTRTDPIDMPYRNGILHGMDLGYDNETVTAKCWCFLFVVSDWIKAKQSEVARRSKFERETYVPSLREVMSRIRRSSELRAAVANWQPRCITQTLLDGLNQTHVADDDTPEQVVIHFLTLSGKRNYGGMAGLFVFREASSPGYARRVREDYGNITVDSFRVTSIIDQAPVISEVTVQVHGGNECAQQYLFRLLRDEDLLGPEQMYLQAPWRIVWIHKIRLTH